MPSAKDIKPDLSRLRVMPYGKPGSGKTHGAATFPDPYFFDFDFGNQTLAGKAAMYDTYGDLDPNNPKAWDLMLKVLRDFVKTGKINTDTVKDYAAKTLVFDSMTTIAETCMNAVQRANNTSGKAPTLQEWGFQMDRLSDWLRYLMQVPANVIVTAHEQMLQDQISQEIYVLPLVPGKKLPQQMPLYFDEVYHCITEFDRNAKDTVWKIETRPADRKTTAKTRMKGLERIEEFDYNKLMAKVKKAYGI
jgi:hypothetical protein